jgi:hypothetical protein
MREHDLGVVTEDYSTEALVRALSALSTEQVERYKANTHAAARALSSDEDEAVTRGVLARLLAG